jgi:hypothetical protein
LNNDPLQKCNEIMCPRMHGAHVMQGVGVENLNATIFR